MNSSNNKQMNNAPLGKPIDFLKVSWRWLVGGAFFGVACGAGYALMTENLYEAMAIVQPATIGIPNPVNVSTTTKGVEIEQPTQTLERLKSPTFYGDELIKVCEKNSAEALAANVKASLLKGNSMIQINYRATSPRVAEACVSVIFNQISKTQAALAAPLTTRLVEQLDSTKQQLADIEPLRSQIATLMSRVSRSNLSPSDVAFVLYEREQAARLKNQLLLQAVQLEEPFTQSTKLLEPIYVAPNPVFPKKRQILLLSLICGLVLGGGVSLIRQTWLVPHKLPRVGGLFEG